MEEEKQNEENVEAQMKTKVKTKVSKHEEEEVFVSMSEATKALWFIENGTKAITLNKGLHKHPLIAGARNVLERIAHAEARREMELSGHNTLGVCCVGACPVREKHYCDPSKDWFLMPILSAGDKRRYSLMPEAWKDRCCKHKLGECETSCPTRFATAVFVHSAYYPPFEVLWRFIDSLELGWAYVVGHSFPEAFGGFYEEATYGYDKDKIFMHVKGNDKPYVHAPLPWTMDIVDGEGRYFGSEVVEVRSNTTLWRVFALQDKAIKQSVVPFEDVRADMNQVGPLQFSSGAKSRIQDDARVEKVTIDLEKLYKFGPVIFSTNSEETFVIPVNLIPELSAFVAGKPRDPLTLKDVIRRSSEIVKRTRVPTKMQHRTLMVGAVLAFSATVPDEVNMIQTAVNKYSSWYTMHRSLITMVPVNTFSCWWIFLFVLLTGTIGVLVFFVEPDQWHIGGTVIFAIALLVVLVYWCAKKGAKMYDDWSFKRWKNGITSAHEASSTEPLLSTYASEPLFPGSRLLRDNPTDVNPNAKVRLVESMNDKGEREVTRMILAGIGFDHAVPAVQEPTRESEMQAVLTRVAARLPPFNLGARAWLDSALSHPLFDWTRFEVSESELAFNLYVNSLDQNEAYKTELRQAFRDTEGTEPAARPSKTFQKAELVTKPIHRGEYEAGKSRLIQAPDMDVKARCGYVISQIYKKVCGLWSGVGRDPRVVYCSGLRPDEVGAVVYRFQKQHGDLEAIENDMSVYDATVGDVAHEIRDDLYKDAGMSEGTLKWLNCTQTAGVTPHGVKYVIEPTEEYSDGRTTQKMVLSGQPDTNLFDTFWNVLCFLAAMIMLWATGQWTLCQYKMPPGMRHFDRIPFLMLVCGDDNITFFPKGYIDEMWCFRIGRFLMDCGLKPNPIFRRNLAECTFCSKAFWPAVDPETFAETIVMGSLIGRSMHRHAYTRTVQGAANIAASTLGSAIDNNHVPLLKPYLQRTKELCVKAKIRSNFKEEFSNFKHVKHCFLPSAHTTEFFEKRYGMSLDDADRELKEVLESADRLPCVVSYRYLERLVAVDMETANLKDA